MFGKKWCVEIFGEGEEGIVVINIFCTKVNFGKPRTMTTL
jgi:hypothetical protein